jgi:hypothetical protein
MATMAKAGTQEGTRERKPYQKQSTGGVWIVLGVLAAIAVIIGAFVYFLWNIG